MPSKNIISLALKTAVVFRAWTCATSTSTPRVCINRPSVWKTSCIAAWRRRWTLMGHKKNHLLKQKCWSSQSHSTSTEKLWHLCMLQRLQRCNFVSSTVVMYWSQKQQFIWSTATCQPTWRCKAGVIRYVSVASGDTGVGLPRWKCRVKLLTVHSPSDSQGFANLSSQSL